MSEQSTFDEDVFLNTEIKEPMETRFTPVPDDDYLAFIDDNLAFRRVNDSPVVDVTYILSDCDALKEKLGMERLTVRQSLFIDVDGQGRIVFGPNKNIRLGRLREALGQNKAGKPWSFAHLKGAGPVKIHVIQRPDKNDPTVIYNDVTRVAAA